MAKTDIASLVLVRCGKTEWDEAGRLQGSADLPISVTGRERLGAALAAAASHIPEPATILTAGDEASIESARMVVAALGGKIREAATLSGIEYGLWQGLLETELFDRYPTAFQRWRADPASVNPPEGETLTEVEERLAATVCKGLDRVGARTLGLVLRPLQFGLMKMWIGGEPTTQLWRLLERSGQVEYHEVPRSIFREIRQTARAGA